MLLSPESANAYTTGVPKLVPKILNKKPLVKKVVKKTPDTTTIGSIKVPTVGVGTISWSSESFFSTENQEVEEVVTEAYRSNAAFFDTAERYGSHFKTAFGMGYGETERMTAKYLADAEESEGQSIVKPVVATKFTPIPWRTTVQSVVDACEQSCKNLGVDQIDLYQIHMPDSTYTKLQFLFLFPTCDLSILWKSHRFKFFHRSCSTIQGFWKGREQGQNLLGRLGRMLQPRTRQECWRLVS